MCECSLYWAVTHQTRRVSVAAQSHIHVSDDSRSEESVSDFPPAVQHWLRPPAPLQPIPESRAPPDWLTVRVCVCDLQMWMSAAERTVDVSTTVTTPWAVTAAPVVMDTRSRVTTCVWVSVSWKLWPTLNQTVLLCTLLTFASRLWFKVFKKYFL